MASSGSNTLLEIGALIVFGIFALAMWQRAGAATEQFSAAGANANRANANTALEFNAGETAISDLNQLFQEQQ